jgi:hypothetical protein
MIQDGVTYASIIEQLGENGNGLAISTLSRWKDGGYPFLNSQPSTPQSVHAGAR